MNSNNNNNNQRNINAIIDLDVNQTEVLVDAADKGVNDIKKIRLAKKEKRNNLEYDMLALQREQFHIMSSGINCPLINELVDKKIEQMRNKIHKVQGEIDEGMDRIIHLKSAVEVLRSR
jgi:hypothetical protein